MVFTKNSLFALVLVCSFSLLHSQNNKNHRTAGSLQPAKIVSESTLRNNFLEHFPKEFTSRDHALTNVSCAGHSAHEKNTGAGDYDWSNKNGTVNVGVTCSTGNPVLDLLPAPVKAVIASIQFIKNIKHEIVWIKDMFGIKRPLSAEQAQQIIDSDPYLQLIFQRLIEIHQNIEDINSEDLAKRARARIFLLEVELPPPYDKKYQVAIKKLKKECADSSDELMNVQRLTTADRSFKKFLKQALIQPQRFVKKINKMKRHPNYQPKVSVPCSAHAAALEFIEQEPGLSAPRLVEFCRKHGFEIVHDLCEYFVQQRVLRDKENIAQDPKFQKSDGLLPAVQQDLLLRNYYKQELESWISDLKITNNQARDETYNAVDNLELQKALPADYQFGLLDSFIQKTCWGIENCPVEIAQTFFHPSGILKKYSHSVGIQKDILDYKIISPQLHQAVNYALAIQEKISSPNVQVICHDILHNALQALQATDNDFKEIHEFEAYALYRYLAENKFSVMPTVEMDSAKIAEFESLSFEEQSHCTERLEAYQKTREEFYRDYQKKHVLSPQVKGYLQAHNINPALFSDLTGNRFQHHITEELIEIIGEAAGKVDHFAQELACFLDVAQSYNHVKEFTKSVVSTDLCWNLLRYHEAVALGCLDTANGFIDILRHPIRFVSDIASGIGTIAKIYGIYSSPINLILHAEEAIAIAESLNSTSLQCAEKIRNSSGPERVRFATHVATEAWASHKALAGIGKLCGRLAIVAEQHRGLTAGRLLEGFAKQEKLIAQCALAEGLVCCDEALLITQAGGEEFLLCERLHEIAGVAETCAAEVACNAGIETKQLLPVSTAVTGATEKAVTTTATILPTVTPQLNTLLPAAVTEPAGLLSSVAASAENSVAAVATLPENIAATAGSYMDSYPAIFAQRPAHLIKSKQLSMKSYLLFEGIDLLKKSVPICHDCDAMARRIFFQEKEKIRRAFGKDQLVKMRFEHIARPSARFRNNNFDKPIVTDLHFDCQNRIEKCGGRVKFLNKVMRQGCYVVKVDAYNCIEPFTKTFFPADWTPERIFQAICEALENAEWGKLVGESIDRYFCSGFTKEGIKIKFVVYVPIGENFIEIVSAYPAKKWILGL